jgi:hypothetical protein
MEVVHYYIEALMNIRFAKLTLKKKLNTLHVRRLLTPRSCTVQDPGCDLLRLLQVVSISLDYHVEDNSQSKCVPSINYKYINSDPFQARGKNVLNDRTIAPAGPIPER